jgi:hypothetical protein
MVVIPNNVTTANAQGSGVGAGTGGGTTNTAAIGGGATDTFASAATGPSKSGGKYGSPSPSFAADLSTAHSGGQGTAFGVSGGVGVGVGTGLGIGNGNCFATSGAGPC